LRRRARALVAAFALALGSAAGAEASTHRVRVGDSLASIAQRQLGDASLWPAIYLANRDRIKDPTRVYPGQLLTIPEVPPQDRDAVRKEADALLTRLPETEAPVSN
jgi:nucleoid-associated protein YgaU